MSGAMIECPHCHDANSCGDYQGPTCEVCMGEGKIPAGNHATVDQIANIVSDYYDEDADGRWLKCAQHIADSLQGAAQAVPGCGACEAIANEEFEQQLKIISDATNDKALSDTGRASIRAIADARALTAQRIASRIRALAMPSASRAAPTGPWAEGCPNYPGCKCDDVCIDWGGSPLPSTDGKSP